jgi:hypothetical protein
MIENTSNDMKKWQKIINQKIYELLLPFPVIISLNMFISSIQFQVFRVCPESRNMTLTQLEKASTQGSIFWSQLPLRERYSMRKKNILLMIETLKIKREAIM